MKFTLSALSAITYLLLAGTITASPVSEADALDARAPVGCSTCNPLPEQNKCHLTTSCIYIWGHPGPNGPNYCACRAGYKATNVGADPAAQWRLPWASQEGRVFVRPGVACDTLCDHWELGKDGCKEVPEYANCL